MKHFIENLTKKQKKLLTRIALGFVGYLLVLILPLEGWFLPLVAIVPYLILGFDILKKAGKGIYHLQPCDENFLMAVASVGAFVLGEYEEAVAVMFLYQIGEFFEGVAVGKSRKNIADLMDIAPSYARVGGVEMAPEEVKIGDVIDIRPGERVPLDGVVETGEARLDTASLTGESLPLSVSPGDKVLSGCIALDGALTIRVTKTYENSTVAKVLDMVENASAKKSKTERFVSVFARYYTPAVCIAALVLGVGVPLLGLIFGFEAPFSSWIYRGLSFLVISCPCALVISIPLTCFACIGMAGKKGILFKGSESVENLGKLYEIDFDKTGTLTEGVFTVTDVLSVKGSAENLLSLCAGAEQYSNHPLSRGIVSACKGKIPPVTEVHEEKGKGISCRCDGKILLVGNLHWMQDNGIAVSENLPDSTSVLVAMDGEYLGAILLSDRVRKGTEELVNGLKKYGVCKTVLLSGDKQKTVAETAEKLGFDENFGELLPGDKVTHMENSIANCPKGRKVAYCGDGINDAPVLALSDVGIAMGGVGKDVAMESADVVVMDGNPASVIVALRLAKKCRKILWENIGFTLGLKGICLILATAGVAGMGVAVFADVGVMMLAVLNATRMFGKLR